MIIALIINSFLLTALAQNPADFASVKSEQAQAAAVEQPMELVAGFDEVTTWSYAHSLPKIEPDAGFGPTRLDTGSLGVLTTADSALVIDSRTKKVLFDKSSDEVRPVASITKLMSALTLLDLDINFSDTLTVHQSDNRIGGRIYVYPGEQFTLQDLWMDGLIASDNVAIAALVRSTGLSESEFAALMNNLAAEIGLENTSFVEPTGINANNVSTARDVSKLVEAALSKTEIADAVRRPIYSFSPLNKESIRVIKSTNRLINSYINEDPYSILGGKTGFTFEAGYCLTVKVDGPADNDDLIAVVLGADSNDLRFQEVKGLVDWTYENFRW